MSSVSLLQAEQCLDAKAVNVDTEAGDCSGARFSYQIEGQIRGIQNMVEEESYCPDILMQVLAVSNALNSFNKLLLSSHIRKCVTEDILTGNDGKVDELCKMLQRLMK